MRRTKEDAERTRQAILKAALKVFSEKGFAAARLDDVAAHADVTRGAIYWHFSGKEELFNELIQGIIKPFFNVISEITAENLAPMQKIEKVIKTLLHKIVTDLEFNQGQQLGFIKKKPAPEGYEAADTYINQEADAYIEVMKKIVIKGQQSGEIKSQLDPMDICYSLYVFVRGLGFMLADETQRDLLAHRIDPLVEVFLGGIKA